MERDGKFYLKRRMDCWRTNLGLKWSLVSRRKMEIRKVYNIILGAGADKRNAPFTTPRLEKCSVP